MARRSDFAQKLLDDLRLRKERLAAASQSSNGTNDTAVADAYLYAKKNYKGSRYLKTSETTGFRAGTQENRYKGGNKFITGEASKEVVSFGDLSMTLAFALENGGKLSLIDSWGNNSVLALLNQIGGRSLDYEKVGRRNGIDRHQSSTSRFPILSDLQLKEILSGGQRLNQILSSCSNGMNFDRYSTEIGKELLKGAVDLEESLQMLINLQGASEYMSNPQRKSRISLLEEDEDEDDNGVNLDEQKQMARPQFSFDKSSRNYHGTQDVASNDLKLRLAALTYPLEATNFISDRQLAPHKQSVKNSSSVKYSAAISEQKNHSSHSQSKMEKGRIPNVIAKLMGLDELPENVDSKHTIQKSVQGSTKKGKKRTEDAENLTHLTSKQKMIKTSNIPAVQNNVASQAEIELAARNAGLQAVIQDGKSPWKDLEGTKSVTGNITSLSHNIGRQKDNNQEKKRGLKGAEKGKLKEPALKIELQWMPPQAHKSSQAMCEDKTGLREGVLRRENVYTSKLVAGIRQKSQTNLGHQQPHMLRKSQPVEEKQQAEEREHRGAKQKLPARKQKGSESISPASSKSMHAEINLQKKQSHSHINHAAVGKRSFPEAPDAMQSERFSDGKHHENLASNRSSPSLTVNIRASLNGNLNQETCSRDQESKLAKPKAAVPLIMEKNPVHDPDTRNTGNLKVHSRKTPRRINEVMVRRGGALPNSARPQKQKDSILQKVKQRRNDKLSGSREANEVRICKSKEPEVGIIKSGKSVASIKPMAVAQQEDREAQEAPFLYSPAENGSQSAKETPTLVRNDNDQQIISVVMNDQRSKEPLLDVGAAKKSYIIESNPPIGKHQGSIDNTYSSHLVYQKILEEETARPLTESENHLKQILIKSHIFLNIAEALFKLNIPIYIFHAGGPDCQDENSKLMLDCGYELMKRKGRRQELSAHPFLKISISAVKIRSLDDLVRQLNKDFEKLKFYGGNVNGEVILEEFLPKLLESDVYNKDPDVNCMWDLSWKEVMFAFTEKDVVIRDMERSVLSGLIEEITTDLFQFQIPTF